MALIGDPDSPKAVSNQLQQMIERLGPIPSSLRSQWSQADELVNPAGDKVLKPNEDDGSWPSLPMPRAVFEIRRGATEDGVKRKETPEKLIKEEERGLFQDFLTKMLQWEACDRATAEGLLKHEWLAEVRNEIS